MDYFDITIDSLAFGGAGVGRLPSGKVVMVAGGAPGDTIRAKLIRDHRSWIEARVHFIIEGSKDRVDLVCPSAVRCGGCSWMFLDIASQQSWKQKLLLAELNRVGLLDARTDVRPLVTGQPLGTRTRCRLHFKQGSLGTKAAGTHEVIPLTKCPILERKLEAFAQETATLISNIRLADCDVELIIDSLGKRGLSLITSRHQDVPEWRTAVRHLGLQSLTITTLGPGPHRSITYGPPLKEVVANRPILFEPGLFMQTNREINEVLVATVAECAGGGHDFIEIYAGVGNLTVHLLEQFDRGTALEKNQRAVSFLRKNIIACGASNHLQVFAESDRSSAQRLRHQPACDVLVADPPRAGMKPLRPLFAQAPPKRVVLISCHPMAAIRDLMDLVKKWGYSLLRVIPLDMFPQTHHLEIVALLEK